jgi:tryptophan-rich sensory protein
MVKIKSPRKLISSLLVCQLAGLLGLLFTTASIANWYVFLNRPSIAPPNWVFAPVWIMLYLLMGVSFYLIWQSRGKKANKQSAIKLFLFQLVLNSVWSIIFFGIREIGWALVEIILLVITLVLVIKKFYKIDHRAAWLLSPYLVWVSFASFLNYRFWVLNH